MSIPPHSFGDFTPPPGHFTCLSSLNTNNAQGQEGIQEVLGGTAPSIALWYDDSSPYTSQETHLAVLATTYDDFQHNPIPRTTPPLTNTATSSATSEEDHGIDDAMGGAGWGSGPEGDATGGVEIPEGVDRSTQDMEEDPWPKYDPHLHDAGDMLFDPTDSTFD
ncbi:hypothetical protein BJV78DRAFT_1282446 [Lactifluus subvellereus]|nr:hypothetical protein BJV78DRAFT_1282446 [Lactifluus subvellereus]